MKRRTLFTGALAAGLAPLAAGSVRNPVDKSTAIIPAKWTESTFLAMQDVELQDFLAAFVSPQTGGYRIFWRDGHVSAGISAKGTDWAAAQMSIEKYLSKACGFPESAVPTLTVDIISRSGKNHEVWQFVDKKSKGRPAMLIKAYRGPTDSRDPWPPGANAGEEWPRGINFIVQPLGNGPIPSSEDVINAAMRRLDIPAHAYHHARFGALYGVDVQKHGNIVYTGDPRQLKPV